MLQWRQGDCGSDDGGDQDACPVSTLSLVSSKVFHGAEFRNS